MEIRIVSDANGYTTDDERRTIVGTIQAQDLYTFYVQGNQRKDDQGNFISDSYEEPTTVCIVLPVGGNLSGLYRFPRVGEKVLVDSIGNNASKQYFLLGYVPSEGEGSIPFAPLEGTQQTTKPGEQKKLLADQQGMVLRYEQTGKNTPQAGEEYSEIGFYHQATSWKAGETVKNQYKEFSKDSSGKDTQYPKTDRINIQSTGDIHAKAKNHYQTQAKRFELLVDCDEVDHTSNKLPLEDMPGDDSRLFAGDAHIRAKNRIIIKAGDEIVLEVGRSTIRINDSGITLSSKKVKGNFVNPWNTVISLTPRDGINMFGQHLNMQGVFDFNLSDAMGGSLSSLGGIVRLQGKDIKAKTLTIIKYLAKQLTLLSQFGITIDAMRSGMLERLHGDVDTGYDTARASGKAIDIIIPLCFSIVNAIATSKNGEDKDEKSDDPIEYFILILDILIKINAASCGVLAEKMRTNIQLKDDIRDQINLAQMTVEFGLMAAAAALVSAGYALGWTHSAEIQLRGSAHINQSSRSYKVLGTEGEDASSPLAGYVDSGVKKVIGFVKDNLVASIIGGIAAALVVGGGAYGKFGGNYGIGTRWDSTEEKNKSVLDELMEL